MKNVNTALIVFAISTICATIILIWSSEIEPIKILRWLTWTLASIVFVLSVYLEE